MSASAAQNAGDHGPAKNGNPSGVRDPINAVTGNMYETREDLNIPGRGLPLQFVRTYNSQSGHSGPLGYGWTHIYNVRLKENSGASITELGPQGERLTFTRNTDGSYTSPEGNFDTLAEETDGSFRLAKKNGVEWSFGVDGKLRSISDPNGNEISFTYNAGNRLTAITDTLGRETRLSYDAWRRITAIEDPAGRITNYEYNDRGDLVSVTDPAAGGRPNRLRLRRETQHYIHDQRRRRPHVLHLRQPGSRHIFLRGRQPLRSLPRLPAEQ